MDLEGIMLSEISQRKKNTLLLIYGIKKNNKMNVYNKTETDSQIKRTNQWLSGGEEEGKIEVWN